MSIHSDSLSDDEYKFLSTRENTKDRKDQEDLDDELDDEDSEGGLIADD